MASADPIDRTLIAKIASAERWGCEADRTAATAPARQGRRAKLAREIDPNGTLPPDELERRVDQLMKAHMMRMSRLAALSRKKSREANAVERAAVSEQKALGGGLNEIA